MVTRTCQVCGEDFRFSGGGLGSSQAVPRIQQERRWVCRACGDLHQVSGAKGYRRVRVAGVLYIGMFGHYIRSPVQDEDDGQP